MFDSLNDKIIHAQNVLRVAVKLSNTYYKKPIAICYSGGKDSDVLLDIAIKTLNKDEFEVVNSHTTLDAPETVYYIRDKFKALKEQGYNCIIKYPTYKGERTSFWKLCEQKKVLPTRLIRFCCSVLKEVSTPKQIACVGVRANESVKRQGRDDFGVRGVRGVFKSAQHTNAMIEFDQDANNNSTFECEIIKNAKAKGDILCNPIYNFTDKEIWQYIFVYHLNYNPLYDKGFNRVGCVGCPMAGKHRYKEFNTYPKYKYNMLKTCERIIKARNKSGLKEDFKTPENMFKWWMEENVNQITIEDILKEGDNND